MSSTILFKFRSGKTFEALPLPGSAARLLDVKKAIVTAKKLDQGSIEFDLAVRDATTNQEYTDDAMLLPRGARLVVQRLPAARGHGILAKIARSQYGGGTAAPATATSAPDQFYTIGNKDDEDEFVSSAVPEDKELAALRAVTDTANASSSTVLSRRPAPGGYRPAGSGPPPSRGGFHQGPPRHHHHQQQQRPNADPELREQEKQPKKRATGIPRTFLNLSAPPNTTGDNDGDADVPLLQPNKMGFTELVHRGGGQSESASGSQRDLDYALKLTATTIPEYLQCAICHGVVQDAMILPWDPEGRTTCERCIRDALTQNGFHCPLTGQDGVSPDDLLPNHALRKAAEQFVKKVIEQMDEIEKQQVEEDTPTATATGAEASSTAALLEGAGTDKGVILSKRASIAEKRKKQEEDDPFGGNDDFGGDVFAVETEKEPDDDKKEDEADMTSEKKTPERKKEQPPTTVATGAAKKAADAEANPKVEQPEPKAVDSSQLKVKTDTKMASPTPSVPEKSPSVSSRRDRPRGPPAGYTMGPAGGALGGPREGGHKHSPRDGGRGGGRFGSGGDRYGGRWNDRINGGRGEEVSSTLVSSHHRFLSFHLFFRVCVVCSQRNSIYVACFDAFCSPLGLCD